MYASERGATAGRRLNEDADRRSPASMVSTIVCAVVETRSREASIAKIDTANATVLEVIVVQDTQSYAATLDALWQLEPDEILLHDGTRGRVLSTKVVEAFHREGASRVLFVSRQYFDQDKGAELLHKLAAESGVDGEMLANYTALAACHCLVRYVENVAAFTFPEGSVRIRFDAGNQGRMSIDRATAAELELLTNARSGSQKESLFGVINKTKTPVGARLLRSNLLRPCTDVATIEERLRLVDFFLSHEGPFTKTLRLLGQFVDMDRVLTGLTTVPRTLTEQTAGKGIGTLIALRHALQLLLPLAAALEEGIADANVRAGTPLPGESAAGQRHRAEECLVQSRLLAAVVDNLKHPGLGKMLSQIDSLLNESTEYTRNTRMQRHQECFALRADFDGMLDVARKTFLQSVEDIFGLANEHSEQYGMEVRVDFSKGRGYHFVLPAAAVREQGLPSIFIQAVGNVKKVTCTTDEVASLSDRAREAVHEALLRTNELVQGLMAALRGNLDLLFAMTEAVALLDMLFSFADLVTVAPPDLPWCRPTVAGSGPLVIADGRHPVVSHIQSNQAFTPNDTYGSDFVNFVVVTGPNGAGKSTLLKQIALIVILAQIGCYVPAAKANIPVRDSILTRIGTSDDMENNISTFLMEMRGAAHILRRMGPRSLVLIDELGRGTSTREGLAIAWAVAEQVLASRAFSFFVTHFAELTRLELLYPSVKNMHLEGAAEDDEGGSSHRVVSGVANMDAAYGIQLAESCGLPHGMIADARELRQVLAERTASLHNGAAVSLGRRAAYELLQMLVLLKDAPMLSLENARDGSPGLLRYVDNLLTRFSASADSILEDLGLFSDSSGRGAEANGGRDDTFGSALGGEFGGSGGSGSGRTTLEGSSGNVEVDGNAGGAPGDALGDDIASGAGGDDDGLHAAEPLEVEAEPRVGQPLHSRPQKGLGGREPEGTGTAPPTPDGEDANNPASRCPALEERDVVEDAGSGSSGRGRSQDRMQEAATPPPGIGGREVGGGEAGARSCGGGSNGPQAGEATEEEKEVVAPAGDEAEEVSHLSEEGDEAAGGGGGRKRARDDADEQDPEKSADAELNGCQTPGRYNAGEQRREPESTESLGLRLSLDLGDSDDDLQL